MTTPDERLWFAMWGSAEEDCRRYRLAWLSARQRAIEGRRAWRALGRANDDSHRRLQRELDRNRELARRVLRLEAQLAMYRSAKQGWGQR